MIVVNLSHMSRHANAQLWKAGRVVGVVQRPECLVRGVFGGLAVAEDGRRARIFRVPRELYRPRRGAASLAGASCLSRCPSVFPHRLRPLWPWLGRERQRLGKPPSRALSGSPRAAPLAREPRRRRPRSRRRRPGALRHYRSPGRRGSVFFLARRPDGSRSARRSRGCRI